MLVLQFQDREGVKPFQEGIPIGDKSWQLAYRYLHTTNEYKILGVGPARSNTFVVYNVADEALKSQDFLKSKYTKLSLTFDQLVQLNLKFPIVFLCRSDWTLSRCTC